MTSSGHPNNIAVQVYARTCGILYLILILLGIVQEAVIRSKIIVDADAAATANNLRQLEMLWRWGIAIELVMMIIGIIICLCLFVLTKPINKNLALLSAFFYMVGVTTEAAYCLELTEPLLTISDSNYLGAFTQEQLNAMTSLFIKSHGAGFAISLLLFGPYFFITGYLIYQSKYLPKLLGIIFMVPGICYMVSSFLLILAPVIGAKYYFFIAGPAALGELSLALWLLIKGVRLEKWDQPF